MTGTILSPESSATRGESAVRPARARAILLALVTLLVLALGAIENYYGNTDSGDVYGSDAVQYLDIARAMGHGDWHSALNPLWSQGYPALLAVARPAFPVGPGGDWDATRVTNFGIFAANYFAFLYLLAGLTCSFDDASELSKRRSMLVWVAGLSVFLATQICMGQVSRVNPDELVTTLFFFVCGMIVRLLYRPQLTAGKLWLRGLLLGLLLGVGFVVKAIFLLLGCGLILVLALALWRERRRFVPALAAAAVFTVMVAGYGAALSHVYGRPTLGEAGSINYAWHVDRLQKWVHWEGGTEPASEAWPSARLARFAQWDSHPPDFGKPIHPSAILQRSPLVYGFAAPFHASYTPYFNPPYWYEGYRHVVRARFQLIALGKSVGDLFRALAMQPIFYAVLLALALLLRGEAERRGFRQWLRRHWAICACGVFAIVIYLPVHLEGRYVAGFLALLMVCAFVGAVQSAGPLTTKRSRLIAAVLLLGLVGDLAAYQGPVWRNVLHHKSPRNNVEWKVAEATLGEGLPRDAQIGVIAWTPNLHCDWAYMAHLQITSEIASGPDFRMFWRMSRESQMATLDTFRSAGAVAVFAFQKPEGAGGPGWKRVGETPMWMYRF